jgi:hypothetical protein
MWTLTGGFDVGELLRLDARELRRCPTTWAKRLAYGRDPRAVFLSAMLASDAKVREEAYIANGPTRGLKRRSGTRWAHHNPTTTA